MEERPPAKKGGSGGGKIGMVGRGAKVGQVPNGVTPRQAGNGNGSSGRPKLARQRQQDSTTKSNRFPPQGNELSKFFYNSRVPSPLRRRPR